MNRTGLRHAGGTDITRCCGREASLPAGPDDDYDPLLTEDGTPIDHEHFPDADLVCPGCERTWGDGCEHQNVTILEPSTPSVHDGSRWFKAECEDCDSIVNVWMQIQSSASQTSGSGSRDDDQIVDAVEVDE